MAEKSKSHGKALLILLVIVALNIAVILALMSLAFSKVPLETAKTDNSGLIEVAMKLQSIPAKIKKSKPGEVDEVTLSEMDVNCLLAAALAKNGLQATGAVKIPVQSLSVKLKDSITQIDFTKEAGFWTPFGRFLNAHMKLRFAIEEDGGAEATLIKLKLGNLNIPPWAAQWWLDREVAKMNGKKGGDDFRRIVISLKTPPGQVVLKYHPYEVKTLIEDKLNTPLLKSFWDML